MLNAIPIVGWLISAVTSVSLAVPFWFCWTYWNLGQIYFGFLPPQWRAIPFWHCVGLFVVLSIIKGIAPTLVASSSSSKSEK
jgi:hypothetical protein